MTNTTFADLSKIDVSMHLEQKQNLSYLKWSAAWALAKNYDPEASYRVINDPQGNPFSFTEAGAMVQVEVTIKGNSLIEVLPVLDNYNNAIRGEKLGVFDINSATKRCLVKGLAMHGLGIQVYIDGQGTPLDLGNGLGKSKARVRKKVATKTQEIPF
jgi:hypothetical protein